MKIMKYLQRKAVKRLNGNIYDNARLLYEEANKLEENSHRRHQLSITRASFLAVSAGVIIGSIATRNWVSSHWSIVVPLALAVLSLILAIPAMLPIKGFDTELKKLQADYVEVNRQNIELLNNLIILKSDYIDGRDHKLQKISKWTVAGYLSLFASGLFLVFYLLEEQILKGGV